LPPFRAPYEWEKMFGHYDVMCCVKFETFWFTAVFIVLVFAAEIGVLYACDRKRPLIKGVDCSKIFQVSFA